MGRGRAKAKQTKVARELKYSSHGTDLDALRAELAGERPLPTHDGSPGSSDDEDSDDDPYAEYAYRDDEDDDEDQASGSAGRR